MIKLPTADLSHVLDHTADLWANLRGQRLFITGGTGFFGCWLLESFLHANDQLNLKASVTVLTRDPQAFANKAPHLAGHPALNLFRGDVATFDFPAGHFAHVIHAATPASGKSNVDQPAMLLQTIIEGTRQTLAFAQVCDAENFLLTSSGAVYGRQPQNRTHIPEDFSGAPDPLDSRSAYGEGKRVAEMLCAMQSRSSNLKVKIARCFAFVGPHLPLDEQFAAGNFIRDALAGGPIQIHGDGTPCRSYLYAADLAIWLWTILLRGQNGRAYNVGSDEAMTIHEIAKYVAHCFRPSPEIHVAKTPVVGAAVEQYVPATDRARTELGLKQLISLPNALAKTIAWHQTK